MHPALVVTQRRLLYIAFIVAPSLLTYALGQAGANGNSKPVSGKGSSTLIPTSRFRSLIVISTLDGQISALDATVTNGKGRLLWSIPSPSGPLFSSSLTNVEFKDDRGAYRLVPALDGNLYSWREGRLQAVPSDLDSLFGQWPRVHNGNSLVGGKDRLSYGIDPDTGELHYICSVQGCKLQNPEDASDMPIARSDVLVIKRVQQTIRSVNKRRGLEKWNVSIGQIDLSLEEGDELDEDWEICDGNDAIHDWQLQLLAAEGLVHSYSKTDGKLLWGHQFSSPIAKVWTLKGTCLKEWDMFNEQKSLSTVRVNGAEPSPSLFLGVHRNQLYVQTSRAITAAMHAWIQSRGASDKFVQKMLANERSTHVELLSLLPHISNADTALATKHDYTVDGPLFQLSTDRPPSFDTGEQASSTELMVVEPIGPGFYYYNTLPLQACGANSNEKFCLPDPKRPNYTKPLPIEVDTSLWPHLPLITFLMIGSAAAALLMYRFYLKLKNKRIQATLALEEVKAQDSSAMADTTNSSPSPVSLNTDSSPNTERTPEVFHSRFSTDFEKIKTLGRGGFGVVFQVRQQFDGQHYAVKRVTLREGMDSKVMREVNALATLEHQNIVRYFTSWTEQPPQGYESDDEYDDEEASQDEDDWEEGESNSELSDAIGALVSPGGTNIGVRNYLRSYPSSDNESSGGIIFETSGGISSAESSRRPNSCRNSPAGHAVTGLPKKGLNVDLKSSTSLSSDLDTPVVAQSSQNEVYQTSLCTSDSELSDDEDSPGSGFSTTDASQEGDLGSTTEMSQYSYNDSTSGGIKFSVSPSASLLDTGVEKATESVSNQLSNLQSYASRPTGRRHRRRKRTAVRNSMSEQSDTPKVYLYIQMQLCQEVDLKDWLNRNVENRSRQEATKIFLQIVRAVGYVHDKNLMHRDLKPSNVFFSHNGRVKVGDFGLATASGHNPRFSCEDLHALSCEYDGNDEDHTGHVGTEIYMSPELMTGQKYSHKVDIFSLGVMFCELLCPFDTQSERVTTLLNVRKQRFPSDFCEEGAEVIKKLLAASPDERPGARDIYKEPIFKDIIAEEAAEGGW